MCVCVFELHDWVTSPEARERERERGVHRREGRTAGETLTGEVEIEREGERKEEKEGGQCKQRKSHSFLPINPSFSEESVS